ncbi:oxygenase MpaB family protein [Gordonia humi]|uniref:Uncharacterized protein (DUF2236 family) n=1 Tax=Gordonia humi TaxID=686429 RepID=A0A840F1W2_9ACTN|nr:oxygenase MpaB family protein [Gordonia humi]MBB4135956.1 uncharacterized protein (DUF2236 family) [Gordonia humi]
MSDLITALGLTSGVANIMMQLSLPGVGYGVHESRVVSGSPRRHPIKRARTTTQYLAVALLGDDEDRARMRVEVAGVHKAVVSTADSPVRYSGNSPELQKWVAACLLRFYLDQYTHLYGELPADVLDRLVRSASVLATTLNVHESAWPQSWSAYLDYWDSMLPTLSIDEPIREDFESLASMRFVVEAWGPIGRVLPAVAGRPYHFMTRAALPPEFRTMMGWTWSDDDQRAFERTVRLCRIADRLGVARLLRLGGHLMLADFRLRARYTERVLGRMRVSDVRIADGGGRRRLAGGCSPSTSRIR